MKKYFISFLTIVMLVTPAFVGIAFAGSKLRWLSNNAGDFIRIEASAPGIIARVQVYVSITGAPNEPVATGIRIQNCGNITRVTPGSSAVCELNGTTNPLITFSSNGNTISYGSYQIDK